MSKDELRVRFGREIRRRRETYGMTLETLAKRSALTPNFIGTIENGKRDPSLSTVLALAKGLGIRPGEFFSTAHDLSPAAEEAGRLYDMALEDVQLAVLSLLRSVLRPGRR